MDTILKTAQVSLLRDGEVSVARSFAAPRALVYKAYTEPALVQRWQLGPPGWSMPVCEMDVRAGGQYRWRWRSDDDGSEFGFHGEFIDVEPQVRLRHTQHFDAGDTGEDMGDQPAMVTVTFQDHAGFTTVTTLVDFGSETARDAALSTGMTDGMEMSYQLLDRLLAGE